MLSNSVSEATASSAYAVEEDGRRKVRVPPCPVALTTAGRAPLPIVPLPHISHFYTQSIWFDQCQGRVDDDKLTLRNTYHLLPSQRLEVGKYVADPHNKDFSNPKYKPPRERSTSRSSSVMSRVSHSTDEYGSFEFSGLSVTASTRRTLRSTSRASCNADSTSFLSNLSCCSNGAVCLPFLDAKGLSPVSKRKVAYPVVEPIYSCSAASLFFPIHYGKLSARDHADPRGLPQEINKKMHPYDRLNMPLANVSVQEGNLNRMCLYKIGPNAVAFRVVINAFEAAGMSYTPSNVHFNVLWAKRATSYTLASLTPYQKVNHFPGTWGIGRKDNLALNIAKMKRYYGDDVFNIVPLSFVIPSQKAELEQDAQRNPDTPERPLVYIVKPSASSCGRGIMLYRGIPLMPAGTKQFVCQRYIGNPFLIHGRKFDLRLYCVVTSFDPLRIYLFDEGLVRFAAEKYPGQDRELDNIHMHLTNYSVNKTAQLSRESKGKNNDSDDAIDIKWCVSDLKKHLQLHHPDGVEAWNTIQRACDDVVIKTFLSIENDVIERIRTDCRDKTGRNCFELFGLDLMVDQELKVRLIEVNIMPSLATGSTLDKAVKSRMLAHMLTLLRIIPHRRDALQQQDPSAKEGGQPVNFVPCGAASTRPERTYRFGRHPNASAFIRTVPFLNQFNDPAVPESMLSVEETLMLVEAEEERCCAGGFRCIFPSSSTAHRYLPLFTHGVRRNNFLLVSAVMMKAGKREA